MDHPFENKSIALKLTATHKQSAKVDKAERMMYGVVVAEAMQIKDYRGSDYGLAINDIFLDDLVKEGNLPGQGILANYGHNWDNLGRRLGRMSNFVKRDGKVYADLRIFKAADKTPQLGNLGDYVLDMAAEDAETMAFSLKFNYEYLYQLDSKGQEYKVYYYKGDGISNDMEWVSPDATLGAVYFKLSTLDYVDLVDEGAATNSLFTKNPELDHSAPLDHINIVDKIKALLGLNKKESADLITTNNKEVNTEELNAIKGTIDGFETQFATITAAQTALQAAAAGLETQFAAISDAQTALQAAAAGLETRIAALEKTPLAKHESGAEETDGHEEELKAYETNPINRAWLARRQKA